MSELRVSKKDCTLKLSNLANMPNVPPFQERPVKARYSLRRRNIQDKENRMSRRFGENSRCKDTGFCPWDSGRP